jgi:hypothetical protein
MKKEYFVKVSYQSRWGIHAESMDEAKVLAKVHVASLVLTGVISLEIQQGEVLVACVSCHKLVGKTELDIVDGKTCTQCAMWEIDPSDVPF